MRVALALTDNQMALLQGPALAVPLVIASIPLGVAIDRYSRVRLLPILAAGNLIGSLLTALISNFTALFAARCLIGLTALAVNPVALSLIADLYTPARRGRATMVMAVGQFAGMAAAFGLGGAFLATAGSGPNSWRWAMVWLAAPLAPVVLFTLAMREPPRTGIAVENPPVRAAWPELWRYRAAIAPLLIGIVATELSIGAVLIWGAPALSRAFIVAPERIGVIMATALLLSGALGPIAGGTFADFCQRAGGPRRTMTALTGLALLSAPAALFAVMPGIVSASILLLVFMTIISGIAVMGTVLFTIVLPNELRGLCTAILAATCVLVAGLAPIVVSLISGAIGGPAMLGKALALVTTMTSLLSAATFALGRRCFRLVAEP
jgi:predicted MFS family arabinose efflux permease